MKNDIVLTLFKVNRTFCDRPLTLPCARLNEEARQLVFPTRILMLVMLPTLRARISIRLQMIPSDAPVPALFDTPVPNAPTLLTSTITLEANVLQPPVEELTIFIIAHGTATAGSLLSLELDGVVDLLFIPRQLLGSRQPVLATNATPEPSTLKNGLLFLDRV